MKMLIALLFSALYLQFTVLAQTPLTLNTASISDVKTVVLPTVDNLLKLIRANDMRFNAAMKRYGYARDKENPASGFSNTVYWITKIKDAETKVLWIDMDLGVISDKMTGNMDVLETDIKKRFPEATHETDGRDEIYVFALKSATAMHHYKVRLIRPTDLHLGVTLIMID